MIDILTDASVGFGRILADSSSDDDGSGFFYAVLFAGPAFYSLMYLRYRNSDKRHHHESETRASLHNVDGSDVFVRKLTGLESSSMDGANHDEVRGKWGSPEGAAAQFSSKVKGWLGD